MMETLLRDEPQTVTMLDSVACIIEWTRSMDVPSRKRFLGALIECSDEVQQVVVSLVNVLKDSRTTVSERTRALSTIATRCWKFWRIRSPGPSEAPCHYFWKTPAARPFGSGLSTRRSTSRMN